MPDCLRFDTTDLVSQFDEHNILPGRSFPIEPMKIFSVYTRNVSLFLLCRLQS